MEKVWIFADVTIGDESFKRRPAKANEYVGKAFAGGYLKATMTMLGLECYWAQRMDQSKWYLPGIRFRNGGQPTTLSATLIASSKDHQRHRLLTMIQDSKYFHAA